MEARSEESTKAYHAAWSKFEQLTEDLQSKASLKLRHSELETEIEEKQREISRLLFEESLRVRGLGDVGAKVANRDEVNLSHKRVGVRVLKTIFGEVSVRRIGYGRPGEQSLFPLDARLNLPRDCYSHGLRRILGQEVAKDSFAEGMASVEARTGVRIGKRQAEEMSQEAALDFDLFYERRIFDPMELKAIEAQPILVLTTDGKGIVMRREDLREATRKKAEGAQSKLKKRASRGEKRHAKRMAQVASVYSIERHLRTPEQVAGTEMKSCAPPPRPIAKRVWASVEKEQDIVIKDLFDAAEGRDPDRQKEWVVLIDGQFAQMDRITSEAKRRKLKPTVIIDLIHVIEYLWKSARCLFNETDPKAEEWVSEHLLEILRGNAKLVAAGLRRSATFRKMKSPERKPIDTCAEYLHNNAQYLQYHLYLKKGFPIATGIIEGACRHLVKDRMDITGARWSLKGAEAVLKLRSLHASGDLNEYWQFHHDQEFERNHESQYANPAIIRRRGLTLVK
jgi:hypothetical protein